MRSHPEPKWVFRPTKAGRCLYIGMLGFASAPAPWSVSVQELCGQEGQQAGSRGGAGVTWYRKAQFGVSHIHQPCPPLAGSLASIFSPVLSALLKRDDWEMRVAWEERESPICKERSGRILLKKFKSCLDQRLWFDFHQGK